MKAKTFRAGEQVLVRLTPGSTIWHPAAWLGLYTLDVLRRPWHQVQIGADRHVVPINRIRKAS